MSVVGSGASGPGRGELSDRARVLTIASWAMLPMFLVTVSVGAIIGKILVAATGLKEGQLLSEAGVTGWLLLILVLIIAVLPLMGGVWLSLKASREGAGAAARAATVVNALLLLAFAGPSLAQQFMR